VSKHRELFVLPYVKARLKVKHYMLKQWQVGMLKITDRRLHLSVGHYPDPPWRQCSFGMWHLSEVARLPSASKVHVIWSVFRTHDKVLRKLLMINPVMMLRYSTSTTGTNKCCSQSFKTPRIVYSNGYQSVIRVPLSVREF
jgi:hypothetical protein